MKFSATAIIAATAVSGAALEKKQADFYSVSEFSASCIPHSVLCSYSFQALASSGQSTPVTCETRVQGPDNLPSVPLTACSSPYTSFAINRSASGLDLNITSPLGTSSNVTGTYHIASSDIVSTQSGAVTTERYTGATSFDAPTTVVHF
ncbi:hypothetical protein SLS53_001427 [Cytospora paraplurivora]|uniref:Hypersensitive response-inducing protein n=1 Tax=Cytospora paraplurivora TaxID=2898453 RepID=A0AAN9YMM1_9PEZI